MKKRICFFTVGFAFNRLVRMRYYEKIFPKDVELFLFTTDKYEGAEKDNYQFQWDLKRTKIHVEKYDPKQLPFKLRKFCDENKIDRLFNIGYYMSCFILLYATLFSKRDFVMNRLADIGYKIRSIKDIPIITARFLAFIFLLYSAKKTVIVDYAEHLSYKKIAKFLFISPNKINFLPAPVNTEIFKPTDQKKARKKLGLPPNKNILMFVGRINYERGSDILSKLIQAHPDTLFILVGRLMNKDYLNINANNFLHFEKKTSKELVDYYNAVDICYNLHRLKHGGLGFATAEALATGTPAISPIRPSIKESNALFQIPVTFKEANQVVKNFFKVSKDERTKLSKEAREYAEKYYSDNANKLKYIDCYLN